MKHLADAKTLSSGRARHQPRQTAFWESFRPLAGLVPRPPREPSFFILAFSGD
jgi:hypothetical protein